MFIMLAFSWLLSVTTTATSAKAADWPPPTTASIPVGKWIGNLTGLPNNKLANVPTLGNGYTGVLLGTNGFSSASVDIWLNTNAQWSCDATQAAAGLPPAVCSLVGMGGISLSPANSITTTSFDAEQRIMEGTL